MQRYRVISHGGDAFRFEGACHFVAIFGQEGVLSINRIISDSNDRGLYTWCICQQCIVTLSQFPLDMVSTLVYLKEKIKKLFHRVHMCNWGRFFMIPLLMNHKGPQCGNADFLFLTLIALILAG